MAKYETEAREKILTATMELIEQHADIDDLKIRDIALKAGVGVGLINYHFQTKENLINQCVQRIVGNAVNQVMSLYDQLEMKPADKMRYLIKVVAHRLVAKPVTSRISILHDLTSGDSGDNSVQITKALLLVIKDVYRDIKTDRELFILMQMLVSSIQVAFLRKDILQETLGINFSDPRQREEFVDIVINKIFPDLDQEREMGNGSVYRCDC